MKNTVFFKQKWVVPAILIAAMIFSFSACVSKRMTTPGPTPQSQPPANTISPSASTTPQPPLTTVAPTLLPSRTPGMPPIPNPVSLDPQKWEHITLPFEEYRTANFRFAQNEVGTIWITSTKLYRYDFKNWIVYDPREIPSLDKKWIHSLAVDPKGTVWIGTDKNEIVSFDGKSWNSQSVEEGGYRDNPIESVLIRKNGELCAISDEGMSCKKDEGQWIRYPFVSQSQASVRQAILSPKDEIWISLYYGWLYHYDGKKWESSQIGKLLGPIASASDDSLWIYGSEGLKKRTNSGNIIIDIIFPYNWKCMAGDLYEARDGTLWIGCFNGTEGYQIIQYKKSGVFETVDNKIINKQDDPSLLKKQYPFGHIYSIFQSKDGSIWFGADYGIFRYHSN